MGKAGFPGRILPDFGSHKPHIALPGYEHGARPTMTGRWEVFSTRGQGAVLPAGPTRQPLPSSAFLPLHETFPARLLPPAILGEHRGMARRPLRRRAIFGRGWGFEALYRAGPLVHLSMRANTNIPAGSARGPGSPRGPAMGRRTFPINPQTFGPHNPSSSFKVWTDEVRVKRPRTQGNPSGSRNQKTDEKLRRLPIVAGNSARGTGPRGRGGFFPGTFLL